MTSEPATEGAQSIDTIEELLAHGKALEQEAAERYEEIADAMEVHNNLEVAELFRKLTGYAQKHAAEMTDRSAGMELPRISPWDFKWPNGSAPESASFGDAHYLMTPYHALRLAHRAEVHAHDFYANIAATSQSDEVRVLAAEFAEEEAGHVHLIEERLSSVPKPEDGWDYDPDPPNFPE